MTPDPGPGTAGAVGAPAGAVGAPHDGTEDDHDGTEDDTAPDAVRQARRYFEQFADDYDEAAAVSGWTLNGRLAGALAGAGPVRSAVDLACGSGATLGELRRTFPGATLTGVDVAPAMVTRAVRTVPDATVVRADVRAFVDRSPGPVDLVTAIGGLEFVPDLPGLLDGVRRMVAPGGHLVFTYEPLLAGWPSQEERVETNLGSNGLELTTFRWEPGEGRPDSPVGTRCAAGCSSPTSGTGCRRSTSGRTSAGADPAERRQAARGHPVARRRRTAGPPGRRTAGRIRRDRVGHAGTVARI